MTKKAIRDAFGEAILDLGGRDPRVVVLTADLGEAIRVHHFAEKYPERFLQMGIAENDMMGTAAGLAIDGKIPFATTFAVFATSLANQPVRLSIAYNRANAKVVASHGGVTVGGDGATHQSFEDLALMRMLPGMTIVVPCDAVEAKKATEAIAGFEGPVYMRLGRVPTPVVTDETTPFVLGEPVLMRSGSDVAIFAIGTMVPTALEAADTLAAEGIDCEVVNVHTLKPLNEEFVLESARRCGAVVTAEEHSILGGLGGAISELLCSRHPLPLERVGVKDTFGESGEPDEILEKYGLTAKEIAEAGRKAARRRG